MNANEQYMGDEDYYINRCEELENKILQQQAEIGALKQIIDANNLSQNIGQFVKPSE